MAERLTNLVIFTEWYGIISIKIIGEIAWEFIYGLIFNFPTAAKRLQGALPQYCHSEEQSDESACGGWGWAPRRKPGPTTPDHSRNFS